MLGSHGERQRKGPSDPHQFAASLAQRYRLECPLARNLTVASGSRVLRCSCRLHESAPGQEEPLDTPVRINPYAIVAPILVWGVKF